MMMTNEKKGELQVSCFPPDRVACEFFMIEGLLQVLTERLKLLLVLQRETDVRLKKPPAQK